MMTDFTLIDSHAHLTDERLADETDGVLSRAREASVEAIVTIASNLDDSQRTVRLAESHGEVFAAVGIHPHEASSADAAALSRLGEMARHDRVVAIGETGLDFYYDNAPREVQIDSFRAHIALAAELNLPVVVHSRNADDTMIGLLRETGWRRGVLHCFSGNRPLLDAALDLGWHISFAGMITFPRWEGAELLRTVPPDRLLVETDSPYLAPVPFRGKRNEPAFVQVVARRAAELRGEDFGLLASMTTANARTLFGIGS